MSRAQIKTNLSEGNAKEHFIALIDDVPADLDDRAIVLLSNHILSNAINRGCTHIHIEPTERQILVHYRKEGVLFSARKLPRAILAELTGRFKSISSSVPVEQTIEGDKAQKSLPYDGRLKIQHAGKNFSFRLSIVPGAFGEHLIIWLD